MNRGIKTTQTNGKYWSFNVSIVEGTLWELSQINISGILASDESDKAPKLEGWWCFKFTMLEKLSYHIP